MRDAKYKQYRDVLRRCPNAIGVRYEDLAASPAFLFAKLATLVACRAGADFRAAAGHAKFGVETTRALSLVASGSESSRMSRKSMGGSKLRIGLGADRFRDPLGLKKIDSAVEIGTCRVLAGSCIPKGDAQSVGPTIELASNPFDDRSATGDQQLDDVVTGVAVRSGSDEAENWK